jgi:hypothetical protein
MEKTMTQFYTLFVAVVLLTVLSTVADNTTLPTNKQTETADISSESDGRWIINYSDSRKIYAVQCGFDVTLFALKYFKIDYSLLRVSLGLPLTTDGIALSDVQQMLQVYGLEAEARKGATIKQIAAKLNGEYIAVIPLGMGNGRNHYYLGVMDDKGIVQLVNVGRGISPLVRPDSLEYNDRMEKRFAEAGGIALFVRRPIKKSDLTSKTIKLFPEQIELGEFMIGGSEAAKDFSVSFELFNTSDHPILVSSVQASCGCTMPNRTEAGHLGAAVYLWHTGKFNVFHVNPPFVRTQNVNAIRPSRSAKWNIKSSSAISSSAMYVTENRKYAPALSHGTVQIECSRIRY